MCIANLSGVLGDMFRFLYSRVCCRLCYKSQKKKAATVSLDYESKSTFNSDPSKLVDRAVKNSETFDTNLTSVFQDQLDEEDERVSVPLTVSMLIMTAYLAIGAVTFNQFEGWGIVTSAYFCFVTVATIGNFFFLF
jgi:potassium channel subfamily K protein